MGIKTIVRLVALGVISKDKANTMIECLLLTCESLIINNHLYAAIYNEDNKIIFSARVQFFSQCRQAE